MVGLDFLIPLGVALNYSLVSFLCLTQPWTKHKGV